MKVLEPTRLMREAAEVLQPVSDRVVVIGAVALEAALAGTDARTPATTDIDCAVDLSAAAAVIAHLEDSGMKPSELDHERGFTWVRNGLKVQLIRPPARVTRPPVSRLVANTQISVAENYREQIAFGDKPEEARLSVARPLAVLALKGHAFGRTRPTGEPVQRDYHDGYLLIEYRGEEIAAEFNATADGQPRGLIRKAIEDLQAAPGREAVRNQITRLEPNTSASDADLRLTRAIRAFARRLR